MIFANLSKFTKQPHKIPLLMKVLNDSGIQFNTIFMTKYFSVEKIKKALSKQTSRLPVHELL
jgi:hypothetical protein